MWIKDVYAALIEVKGKSSRAGVHLVAVGLCAPALETLLAYDIDHGRASFVRALAWIEPRRVALGEARPVAA